MTEIWCNQSAHWAGEKGPFRKPFLLRVFGGFRGLNCRLWANGHPPPISSKGLAGQALDVERLGEGPIGIQCCRHRGICTGAEAVTNGASR